MLLHGDIRADNMFFDGDRLQGCRLPVRLCRAGANDIAYLVSQGLPVETRRGHDEELVRHYLDRLGAVGLFVRKPGGTIVSPSPA